MKTAIDYLQHEVEHFLCYSMLKLNEVTIQPTEIEVYYFNEGEFEDTSVHKNELQQNNASHFYIHRRGKAASDSYKGGNRAGIDFVLSNQKNKYYTYLIRSAIINGYLAIGPHNVLVALLEATKLSQEGIENTAVQVVENNIVGEVLFSKRINLGKNAGEFCDLDLRAVLCDDIWFKQSKYPAKEQMIIDFILKRNMPQEHALEFAQKKLGYIPKRIRQL